MAGGEAWRPSLRFVPGLDGLRGFAVLCVFVAHISPARTRGAFLGVNVFFVVSGFLITSVLTTVESGELRRFYSRRAVRLVPALILAVALAAALQPVIPWQQGPFGYDAARALTFSTDLLAPAHHASSLIPTWSLGVEEQFYLLWAPAMLFLAGSAHRRRLSMTAGLVGAFALLRAVMTWRAVGGAYLRPWASFDQLLVGAVLCFAIRTHAAVISRWVSRWWVVATCVLVVVTVMAAAGSTDATFLYRGGFTVLGAAVALVVARVVLPGPSTLRRALESRALRWTGRRSYGIYLFQGPLILACDGLRTPRPLSCAIALALTLGAAAASWKWVESPLLGWHARSRGKQAHDVAQAPETAFVAT